MENNLLDIEGTVEEIIFKNVDNGYIVLTIDSGGEFLSVVGNLGDISEGEHISLKGEYINSPKYGRQFKAVFCQHSLPTTVAAIQKYLGSGVIKGVGPAIAKRIVRAFGVDTFEIIETEPHRLSSINGITPHRASYISSEFNRINSVRGVISYLARYNIQPITAINAWKRYDEETISIIQRNPYVLCEFGIDVEFQKADEIAAEMGFTHDDSNRVKAGLIYILKENNNAGHTCLPLKHLRERLCEHLGVDEYNFKDALEMGISSQELIHCEIKNREYVYLSQYYFAESYIASKLSTMLKNSTASSTDYTGEIEGVEFSEGIKYEKLQKQGIEGCMQNQVFILTGGPGTGKTTTLNGVIRLCKQRRMIIKLAAPTGRAAKRISDLTGEPAQTIHRLLEVDFSKEDMLAFKHNSQNPLNCDLVIIDEMSMVDALLMEALLSAIKPTCKLIMVGDSNQLPSVGAGNILKDLITSGFVPTVQLKEIFRQAAKSLIVTNAHKIVNGEMPQLDDRRNDFFFMEMFHESEVVSTLIDLNKNRLPKTYGFSPLEDIQILTPTRQGEVGTKELNKSLQLALNPPARDKREVRFFDVLFRTGDKVMQVKNDYDVQWRRGGEKGTGVFNGDIGIIQEVNKQSGEIIIDFEGRIAVYQTEMLQKLEHAYAITIHKSQGSEYDAVLIPLPNYLDKLIYRNLLYTAVTRAKKILILVGTRNRVFQMVDNNRKTLRYSCLKAMLEEKINE